ncbi:hypothetical protein COY52_10925 [Candidatus Desantisbacteria bacterium CG_4_10_14_0_8_um_filter_48_22]|uniref:PorV/PorQ family protein n=1 Tax=Candidatus Desantisbacteria bacterium CG_4_10_14_0_8_um_filter_48_22 TaxID=1974543 RepID=A0A2M7S620_9BACT|nr:MAG: hypothetical protein AUJ67_01285 [Candidatus Desantisbacteria bacterium CG1_02_49_89]PIV56825.1 MAG: hypothetical protein COS16_02650 [Candidatus Desantisbacteria bacterium CG02_land_8_20_14_3_00_49_13]PIZ14858.1 MAG: hypothetical protein COY52_10925 [Candidatus Desantisbacteria bacterium CG_4_10_14_0_8_um_filter_48_22]PJB27944.1 MAG: hypothetical protein CO111_02815 [Candidatus Desantisbacteria bacterium CG_4_9_14_3_um_filter_50_7]
MKIFAKITALLLVAAVCVAPAFAGEQDKGTAGLQFLKMEAGARPVAMGSAFVAAADDINASYWNPAGLIEIDNKQVTFMHNVWVEGISAEYLAYAQPVERIKTVKIADGKGNIRSEDRKEKILAFGANFTYTGYGSIPKTLETAGGLYGGQDGTFTATDYAIGISAASKLLTSGSIGLTVKMVSSTIGDYSAFGAALDFGIIYTINDYLKAGFMLQNFGTTFRYLADGANVMFPSNIKAGVACKILNTKEHALMCLFDVNAMTDNVTSVNAGVEYTFNNMISARVGYKGSEPAGITFGGGAQFLNYLVDYAFVPFGDLGTTHRISITAKF